MSLTDHQIYMARTVATISASLSMFGTLFIIFCFIVYKELRTFQSKLVVSLSVAGLGK